MRTRRPRRSLVRVLALSLCGFVASGCLLGEVPHETLYHVDGSPALLPPSAAYVSELNAVGKRAEADLACTDITVEQSDVFDGRPNGDYGGRNVFRARGCGRQRLYLRDTRLRYQADEGSSYGVELFDLSHGDAAALPASDDTRYVRSVMALNAQAAIDLKCPRDEVVPQLRNLGRGAYVPFADGCGRRATYVPMYGGAALQFELASLVDVPGAPSFVSWPPSDVR
jgi:hypothetical protein